MMWLITLVLLLIILSFGFVLLFGAPYLPTLTTQVRIALNVADLEPGQALLELGCGDGKVLIAAAKKGIYCVGYELNPLLFLIAWVRTIRYRRYVRVVLANFWQVEWPSTDVIFVFLLDKYMHKLDDRIGRYGHRPVRLISFAFKIPNRKPVESRKGIYVYDYD